MLPNKNEFYSWNDYEPYIRPLLKLLIENGNAWNVTQAASAMDLETPIHVLMFSVSIKNWAVKGSPLALTPIRRKLRHRL